MNHSDTHIGSLAHPGDRGTNAAMGIVVMAIALATTAALICLALAVAANVPG